MADLEFDDFQGDYSATAPNARLDRARRIVNISGAVCSVALVLGLGIWGYKLAVRDVTGVPVMRALLGPMRIAPADPGGDQASHQGLSVNAVAATGTSAEVAEQLTLAPRPIELEPSDEAGIATNAAAAVTAAPVQPLAISSTASSGATQTTQSANPDLLDEGASGLVDATSGDTVNVTDVVATSAVLDTNTPKLVSSLRPQPRPSALRSSSKPTGVRTVSAVTPAPEVDPASLAVGTRLAQLGAFDTPDLARERFHEYQADFGDLMAGKSLVIQEAQSGGRAFYRLRALGFEGDDDARRFCAALQAALESPTAVCIPVAHR